MRRMDPTLAGSEGRKPKEKSLFLVDSPSRTGIFRRLWKRSLFGCRIPCCGRMEGAIPLAGVPGSLRSGG